MNLATDRCAKRQLSRVRKGVDMSGVSRVQQARDRTKHFVLLASFRPISGLVFCIQSQVYFMDPDPGLLSIAYQEKCQIPVPCQSR